MNATKHSTPIAKMRRLKKWFRFICVPRRLSFGAESYSHEPEDEEIDPNLL